MPAKILVVEDENVIALDIKGALERLGYSVPAVARSGERAIQQAAQTQPDLVLMDIKLSGAMDGIEAAEQIRARFQIPVVYLTANVDDQLLQRAKVTGPFGYMLKPLKYKDWELKTAIEMALYKHKAEVEIRQYNQRLLRLHAASAAIASSLDPQHVWETVAREMAHLLEVKACATFEWQPATESIHLSARYSTNGRWKTGRVAEDRQIADHPITRGALLERRPRQMRIDQPDLDPTLQIYMQQQAANTLAVLPMVCQDRAVGLVEILDPAERTFTEQELSLAQLLANHAASAVENARLYQEIRQWARELTTLTKIGQAINSTLDLQEALTLITDHTLQLLDAEAASVALKDGGNDEMWFVAASGRGADSVRGKRLSTSQGIAGWTIRHGQPVLVPDLLQDPRFIDSLDQQSGLNTRSILCVPLQTKGQSIGVIEAINKRSGPFDQDDVRLLSSLAAPATTAIENARLYRRSQQEILQRKRAETALEAERISLAQRVAERTTELRKVNAELAEASNVKDRFVSNVSHELRTPLSVITLLSGNLDMFYEQWDDDRRQKTVRDIREQARALNSLIESVLEISRIDSKRISSVHEQVNLVQLAREEAEKQGLLAQKKSQTLRVTGLEHLAVLGNENQLRQVVGNLLSNAIKYTPDGGQITCECQEQSRKCIPSLHDGAAANEWPGAANLPDGRWAAVRVIDTGIGISPSNLPRLFERFYRVNEQGNIPGVGLGLAIAKELVALHNGYIAVASTPGQGSVFAFYVPLSAE